PEGLVELVLRATADPPPESTVPPSSAGSEYEEIAAAEAKLAELHATSIEASGDLEAAMLEWAQERQDAESKLELYRMRAREVRGRIRDVESSGAESPCPTCGRPLGRSADAFLESLRGEWEGLVQDGRWWRLRR